jgi:hypothetical protein
MKVRLIKLLFILFSFINYSKTYAGVVWERNIKLMGYSSIETSREAYNWRTGLEAYSNLKYGVKSNFLTFFYTRYEEVIERGVKSKGLDECILHLIYRNYFTRFFYWSITNSNWTPVSNFGNIVYDELSFYLGYLHTRRLAGEYGFEVDKLLKPDNPATYWLKASIFYSTPIGWRGRASMYTQLLPKINLEEFSYCKLYFVVGYEYKFTNKVGVKIESLMWYDSKINKVDSKSTIDIVVNIY